MPNQELARESAEKESMDEIGVIAENLRNRDKAIRSNCMKVLYEIGYLKPELIADYVTDFLKLLSDGNNRLVWGSMIALSTIAGFKHQEIFESREILIKTIEAGSVITVDAGILALSGGAASGEKYNEALFPYLLDCLKTCRPKSVAQYAESVSFAVSDKKKNQFVEALIARKEDLSPPQWKRVEKLLKKFLWGRRRTFGKILVLATILSSQDCEPFMNGQVPPRGHIPYR